jgi:hypothetical protein
MKSLPLSELRRRPSAVKKLTARGQSVQITERGKPLWIMQRAEPANGAAEVEVDKSWMDTYLDDLLKEPILPAGGGSLAEIVCESRGKF